MRGHGATVVGRNVRHAVYVSVYLEVNARLQKEAMAMGSIKFLTPGEVDKVTRAHRSLRHQPGLGELVRPCGPGDAAGAGVARLPATISPPRRLCVMRWGVL